MEYSTVEELKPSAVCIRQWLILGPAPELSCFEITSKITQRRLYVGGK